MIVTCDRLFCVCAATLYTLHVTHVAVCFVSAFVGTHLLAHGAKTHVTPVSVQHLLQ